MKPVDHLITLQPPYYAVVFTSIRREGDNIDYSEMADRMRALASEQPGFLGFESARQDIGISISYWESLDDIRAWKENVSHRQAQERADDWYRSYRVRICRVEREYGSSITS